jgi:transposase-like protein
MSTQEIATRLNIKDYTVRDDLTQSGLAERKRNLDRSRAYQLADSGMPWRQAANEAGVSHSQFCKWMRESGRKPPPKKSKQHLKPQAFALYDKGTSWEEICSTVGIASATLSQWLRSRGRTKANNNAALEFNMNSATRVLATMTNTDGTDEVARDRLIFKLASEAMGASDDAVRPFTHAIAYLESLLPGKAVNELRGRYAAQLTAEASK